jgi:hypothetical protein
MLHPLKLSTDSFTGAKPATAPILVCGKTAAEVIREILNAI